MLPVIPLNAGDQAILIHSYKLPPAKIERISMRNRIFIGILSIFLMLLTSGCQKVYYDTMEKFGVHKRDIMVDRVEDARDSQEEAKEQFQSALEQFSSVLNFKGGKLEEKYKTLQAEYDKSEAKADDVKERIDAVEDVSEALFSEWKNELDQYSSASLRRDSERKMVQTRRQYDQLIVAMRKAETKIDPVLRAFRDQVLYLKHNLNAQAIASLQSELVNVESDIADPVQEMERSIGEANSFIKPMHGYSAYSACDFTATCCRIPDCWPGNAFLDQYPAYHFRRSPWYDPCTLGYCEKEREIGTENRF
jgi:hypothetical protein